MSNCQLGAKTDIFSHRPISLEDIKSRRSLSIPPALIADINLRLLLGYKGSSKEIKISISDLPAFQDSCTVEDIRDFYDNHWSIRLGYSFIGFVAR